MKLEKVFILGSAGSGKTNLAYKLSKKLKIKIFELDNIVFDLKKYIRLEESVRDKQLKTILKRKRWIIEGAYSKPWAYPIMKKADYILILDVKPIIAKKRIFLRYLKNKIVKSRRPERLKDLIELFGFIDKSDLKIIVKKIKRINRNYKNKIVILRKKQINNFIKDLK